MAAGQMSRLVHPDADIARREKLVAIGILAAPLGMLLMFGIGETAGGDVSGVQHFVTAAPLAALAVLAWFRPRIAGWFLVVLGALLAVAYLIVGLPDIAPAVIVLVELIPFLPPIVAGIPLIFASRAHADAR